MSETPVQKGNRNAAAVVLLDRRTLLSRHREGDPSAFPEFVSIFRSQVYSYIVRCGVYESARDDLFQEIFVKVHLNAHQYQPERPLEPWLFTVVANTVRSHYRKHRIRELIGDRNHESEVEKQPAGEPDAEAHANAKETAEWLEDAIAKLPFSQREVLTLSCLNGLSQKDVARILQLPVNTVKTHLSRGRVALAKALALRNATSRAEVAS